MFLYTSDSYMHTHAWKVKISKILNFRNPNFKTCRMPTKMDNLKLKWLCLDNLKTNQRSYYYPLNSAFWGWLSMESQPQNPEFRINPEIFHPCIPWQTVNWCIMWHFIRVYTVSKDKMIFQRKNTILIGKYNLWPLNVYNGPSQVYCNQPGGRIH